MPLIVIGAWGIEILVEMLPPIRRSMLARVGVVFVLLWLVYPAARDVRDTHATARDGVGYANNAWRHSQLALAVRPLVDQERVYANDPDGLYIGVGKGSIYLGPRPVEYDFSTTPVRGGPSFAQTVACLGHVLFAVTTVPGASGDSQTVFTPDQLRKYVRLQVVNTFADGTLYQVTPLLGQGSNDRAKPGGNCEAPLPTA